MGRMFGTNGVRGRVNEYLTPDLALQLGKAIAYHMKGTLALAMDTRTSGEMIKNAVISGVLAVGYDVVDLGVLPTPALQLFVKNRGWIAGGIMITASHNPPEYNGIKCISDDGTELSRIDESSIENYYGTKIPCASWDKVGLLEHYGGAAEEYVDSIVSKVDADMIRKADLAVVVDCANGAACETTPLLMKKLGVRAVTLNTNPQGEFPGHNCEPTEENLRDLMSLTDSVRADLGFAHDGDADRCIFVTHEGKYISGDAILALLSKQAIEANKGGIIVTPVATSSMVEDAVKAVGGTVEYTVVGSPAVARKMIDNGAVFGGEGNGGLIFPDHQFCRDGAMAAARILEMIARVKLYGPDRGLTKSKIRMGQTSAIAILLSELPVYYTKTSKIECSRDMAKSLMELFRENIKDAEINDIDGIKFIYPDAWVLMRPSGTEDIFRITVESKSSVRTKSLMNEFVSKVDDYLDEIRTMRSNARFPRL